MIFRKRLALILVPLFCGLMLACIPAMHVYGETRNFPADADSWLFTFYDALLFLLLGIPVQYYATHRLWTRWAEGLISSRRMYATLFWYACCVTVFGIILLPNAQRDFGFALHAAACLFAVNCLYFILDFGLCYLIWIRLWKKKSGDS
jgi:hypothetical protein